MRVLKSPANCPLHYAISDVCRGSRINLQLSYPHGWCAFYRNGELDWVPLMTGKRVRPTYQEIENALIEADVPFKFTEFDLGSIV